VNYIHVTLHKALKQAVADGLLPRNVTEAVKAPKPEKKEIRSLTPEQARAFLMVAAGDRLEAFYVLASTAGMRQGEMLGLRWQDVNFETGTLSVRRTLASTKGGVAVYNESKTATGRRNVKLSGKALEALKRHRVA
jgi:integrase